MKKTRLLLTTAVMTAAMGITAFAGQWMQNATGWWYDYGNGTWPASSWQWIDGNNDGTAECYYFDQYGYMAENTTTPDGFTVDASGAWVENGVVQTKDVTGTAVDKGGSNQQQDSVIGIYRGYYTPSQGQSGIDVEIYEDFGELWATVKFYSLEGRNNTREGSYLARITKTGSNSYRLEGDSWLDSPAGLYVWIDWDVEIEDGMLKGESPTDSDIIIRCEKIQ